ncbi:hypothetical protein TNCV_868511 [Trichonephila clavipes]|nr:hypothetical protein TNCV_868511 [Trichonephila clavipes]
MNLKKVRAKVHRIGGSMDLTTYLDARRNSALHYFGFASLLLKHLSQHIGSLATRSGHQKIGFTKGPPILHFNRRDVLKLIEALGSYAKVGIETLLKSGHWDPTQM